MTRINADRNQALMRENPPDQPSAAAFFSKVPLCHESGARGQADEAGSAHIAGPHGERTTVRGRSRTGLLLFILVSGLALQAEPATPAAAPLSSPAISWVGIDRVWNAKLGLAERSVPPIGQDPFNFAGLPPAQAVEGAAASLGLTQGYESGLWSPDAAWAGLQGWMQSPDSGLGSSWSGVNASRAASLSAPVPTGEWSVGEAAGWSAVLPAVHASIPSLFAQVQVAAPDAALAPGLAETARAASITGAATAAGRAAAASSYSTLTLASKSPGLELALGPRADTVNYAVDGVSYFDSDGNSLDSPIPNFLGITADEALGSVSATNGGYAMVYPSHLSGIDGVKTTLVIPVGNSVIADGMYTYNSISDGLPININSFIWLFGYSNAAIDGEVIARNGGQVSIDWFGWQHGASPEVTQLTINTAGNNSQGSAIRISGSNYNYPTFAGTIAASLNITHSTFGADSGLNGPDVTIENFTHITMGTGVTVNAGALNIIGRVVSDPVYWWIQVKQTYLTGSISFSNGARGNFASMDIGDVNSQATVIDIDPTSKLTLQNVDLFNMDWMNHLNGTLYIAGTVRDGGFFTGMDVSGTGTLNVLAGATLTTVNQTDNTNALMYHGHPGVTLTGQGTVDRVYPVNRGTVLSPDSGVLTIKALPEGQSWSPVADPTTPPINGTSLTFYNYAGGVIRYKGGGGILLSGFTDGIDNQGLIEALSGASLAASAATGLGGHVFSTQQDAQGKIIRGTIRANGASVVWGPNAATDSNALVESQFIQVVNGASVIFDYYDFKNVSIDASPLAAGGTGGSVLQGGTGAVQGTIGTASQDVSALTTFSNVTLTGAATVLQLSGSQSIALDASRAEPGLGITNDAQLQLVGNGAHTVYGTTTTPVAPKLSTGSLGYGIGRITLDTGGSLLGAGNTTPHQFGLTLGSGGTVTVYNPNLTHDVATINLADAPVLPPFSPFRFSAASAPGAGNPGTLSAASLPGATSAQTLTLLGDLQMAANSTLGVTIFGDATNANSLLIAGSAGTAASTLAGTLSVTVAPGVASLSATTLFVVFQENGAGYSGRFANAPATGSTISSADGNWIFGVNYTGNQVILGNATPVPEPATTAAGFAAAALLVALVRRSQRSPNTA